MFRTISRVSPAAVLLVAIASTPTKAQMNWVDLQNSGSATYAITGTGTSRIAVKPTALRMYIELTGRGPTLKEGLAKLNERREAALLQLEMMGADKQSITSSDPSLSTAQSQHRQQVEMMIGQRLMSLGRKLPEGLKTPTLATVSQTLSADLPLKTETAADLLLESNALIEKIKEADLGGTKEQEELSPEEEELMEEMTNMMGSDNDEVAIGEPYFTFVGRISDEQRDNAMAEGFKDAVSNASRLVRATGMALTLGPLVGMHGTAVPDGHFQQMSYGQFGGFGYAQREYHQQLVARHNLGKESDPNEVTAASPSMLSYRVVVRASYKIVE